MNWTFATLLALLIIPNQIDAFTVKEVLPRETCVMAGQTYKAKWVKDTFIGGDETESDYSLSEGSVFETSGKKFVCGVLKISEKFVFSTILRATPDTVLLVDTPCIHNTKNAFLYSTNGLFKSDYKDNLGIIGDKMMTISGSAHCCSRAYNFGLLCSHNSYSVEVVKTSVTTDHKCVLREVNMVVRDDSYSTYDPHYVFTYSDVDEHEGFQVTIDTKTYCCVIISGSKCCGPPVMLKPTLMRQTSSLKISGKTGLSVELFSKCDSLIVDFSHWGLMKGFVALEMDVKPTMTRFLYDIIKVSSEDYAVAMPEVFKDDMSFDKVKIASLFNAKPIKCNSIITLVSMQYKHEFDKRTPGMFSKGLKLTLQTLASVSNAAAKGPIPGVGISALVFDIATDIVDYYYSVKDEKFKKRKIIMDFILKTTMNQLINTDGTLKVGFDGNCYPIIERMLELVEVTPDNHKDATDCWGSVDVFQQLFLASGLLKNEIKFDGFNPTFQKNLGTETELAMKQAGAIGPSSVKVVGTVNTKAT